MATEHTNRERTIRVALDVTVSRPPGRGKTWTVQTSQWLAEGVTEKAATDLLAGNLQHFLAQYRTPKVLTFRGYVAVVSSEVGDGCTPIAWQVQIVSPDGHTSGYGITADSWEEAEAHARHTIAQRSTDWHDDASVHEAAGYLDGGQRFGYGQYGPDDFCRYAAWQRAAKAAMAKGRDDWHEWASAHEAEFTVPRRATA